MFMRVLAFAVGLLFLGFSPLLHADSNSWSLTLIVVALGILFLAFGVMGQQGFSRTPGVNQSAGMDLKQRLGWSGMTLVVAMVVYSVSATYLNSPSSPFDEKAIQLLKDRIERTQNQTDLVITNIRQVAFDASSNTRTGRFNFKDNSGQNVEVEFNVTKMADGMNRVHITDVRTANEPRSN